MQPGYVWRPLLIFAICSLPFGALGALALAQSPAGSTPPSGQPPRPPSNLQVLPKDTARPQVLVTMRSFTAGLGVTCDFCHVEDSTGRNDFASDDLPSKRTARAMMVMVSQINEAINVARKEKPASEIVKVECVTCHRGQAVPANQHQ